MKIVNKAPAETADVSAARGTAFKELRRLLLFTVLLAVGVYLAIGLVVDLVLVPCISFEREAALFGSAFARDNASGQSEEKLDRLKQTLQRLVADPEVPPLPYALVLLDKPRPNAFAFPGGTIGVTQGLLDSLDNEIEFAFVLGHELGHFRNRDHLRGLGRALGVAIAYAVIFGGEMGQDSLGNVFQFVLSRGYSRRQERRADEFGIELVYRTYGRTDGVDRLFRILRKERFAPAWAYMLATHPSPNDRIRELEEHARRLGAGTTPR